MKKNEELVKQIYANRKDDKFPIKDFSTIKGYLQYVVQLYKDIPAFIKKKDNIKYDISYIELEKQIINLGLGLYQKGFERKKVMIIGDNSYEWILLYLTCLYAGILVIPLDKALKETEIENSIKRVRPDAIFVDDTNLPKIENISEKEMIPNIFSLEDEAENSLYVLMEEGSKVPSYKRNEFIAKEIDPDEAKIYVFTSGTTAQSKIVMLSNRNIVADIIGMQRVIQFEAGSKSMLILPLHHVFASTGTLYFLYSGITGTFVDSIRMVGENVKEYQPAQFFAVPAILELIYKKIIEGIEKQGKMNTFKFGLFLTKFLRTFGIDIRRKIFKDILANLGGNLSCVISGAAAMEPKLIDNFKAIGIDVYQGYGLTETSPCIASINNTYNKSGTIGYPIPNVEVRLADIDEEGMGELQARGPIIFLGYYNDDKATKEAFTEDGWFKTGDLAIIDKKGYITITGRRKDMIVLENGKKIFPEELETLINKLPYVKESMVYAIKDKGSLQTRAKIVYDEEYLNENLKISVKELKEKAWEDVKEINKTLPVYKYIRKIDISAEELDKTTTLKIKRHIEMQKILKTK